jgi:hypothetical protein
LDSGKLKPSLRVEQGKVQVASNGSATNILHRSAEITRLLISSDEVEEIVLFFCQACLSGLKYGLDSLSRTSRQRRWFVRRQDFIKFGVDAVIHGS